MNKTELSIQPLMYPMPVVLVGSIRENGKVNVMTAAYCGIISHRPPMLYISLTRSHATVGAIQTRKSFSVNIPTIEILRQTDYCGITSGKRIDKSEIFRTFYTQDNIPLIEECAVNIACNLETEIDLGGHDIVFVGKIAHIYASEQYLTNGKPDMEKICPLCLDNGNNRYFRNGQYIADAYSFGKSLRQPD